VSGFSGGGVSSWTLLNSTSSNYLYEWAYSGVVITVVTPYYMVEHEPMKKRRQREQKD
jgi:hypothetical protein